MKPKNDVNNKDKVWNWGGKGVCIYREIRRIFFEGIMPNLIFFLFSFFFFKKKIIQIIAFLVCYVEII